MSNKKQTAVTWYIYQLDLLDLHYRTKQIGLVEYMEGKKNIQDQAKAMEKEQHDDTWLDSRTSFHGDDYIGKQQTFEQYYKETYGE